jgi:hypothetical protein
MQTGPRFNPLDTRAIGGNVMEALLRRPAEPLGALAPFIGAGIYAVYYTGSFLAYAPIAAENRDGKFGSPLYVGKAIPPGAQTGLVRADEYGGRALYNRLAEHAESVRAATNLDITEFFCRYLVVDDVWIPLAETLLITRFSPLWNMLVRGFGNHDPGGGRHAGTRPIWDTLHPGRPWAAKCQARDETPEQWASQVEVHLAARAALDTLFLEAENGDSGSNPA